jgi:hypothetical protein
MNYGIHHIANRHIICTVIYVTQFSQINTFYSFFK